MVQAKNAKSYALLSVGLLGITILALAIGNGALLAAQLGISTAAAASIVEFFNVFSTVTYVITIVGLFTGVGTIASGVAATVLALLKKQGKAKAAAY